MRLAIDTGGTFTDLVLEDDDGALDAAQGADHARTIPSPACSRRSAAAAGSVGSRADELLRRVTTCSCTARRARPTPSSPGARRAPRSSPRGAPATILLFREGGRDDRSTTRASTREPYVPRRADVRGRRSGSAADGEVVRPLDDDGASSASARSSPSVGVEAVAVCLLWSIVNPAHELRVGELLARASAGRPGHALAPAQPDRARVPPRVRRPRIDASLKPLMCALPRASSSERLRGAGFARPAADGHVAPAACWTPTTWPRAPIHSHQLRPGDGAGRRPPLRERDAGGATRPSSPTPAARATTSASCAAARSRGRARRGSATASSAT